MNLHLFGWSGTKGWDRCRRCGLFRELQERQGRLVWWHIGPMTGGTWSGVDAGPCKEAA